jgi:hypothetical protein
MENTLQGVDHQQVVDHILKLNMGELLDLAEGVGEFGEYEAFSEERSLDEFQK